ncbi:zinc finger, CCHC-type containing protein [Tanacetum coccineum]
MAVAMKYMASNFAKLENFKGVDFRRWQKKMHFLLSNMSVVYVLTTPMPEDGCENPTVEQDNDKPKGNNVDGPSVVNMVEHNNSSRYNDNKGKHKHHDTKVDPKKKPKVTCWKCGKPGHLKKDCKAGNIGNKANGSGTKGSGDGSFNSLKGHNMFNKSLQVYYATYVSEAYFVKDDDVVWWVDSGATVHVCKDRCWFKTYESLNDRSILHMGNESTALVHGRGCVDLRLGHAYFKRIQDMYKDGLILAFNMDTEKCKTCMLNKITKKPFQNVKHKIKVLELIHNDLCDLHATPSLGNKKYFVTFIDDALRTDRRGEYMDTLNFQSVGLSQGLWGEAMAVVRLPDPKLKTLGERGIECIFVGYVKHSKAFRFYVIEPNDLVDINSIIESKDDIFDENKFSSVPRPSQRSLVNETEDYGGSVVPEKVTDEVVQPELRKSKRHRTPKDFGPEFQLYLIERTRDEVSEQHSYCFNVEDDPKIFDEAIKSQDVAFWKKLINDEMDSIMDSNT